MVSKPKKPKKNKTFGNDKLYTIQKPMLGLISKILYGPSKKIEKYENDEFWIKLT